jgi:hypothetical protein
MQTTAQEVNRMLGYSQVKFERIIPVIPDKYRWEFKKKSTRRLDEIFNHPTAEDIIAEKIILLQRKIYNYKLFITKYIENPVIVSEFGEKIDNTRKQILELADRLTD